MIILKGLVLLVVGIGVINQYINYCILARYSNNDQQWKVVFFWAHFFEGNFKEAWKVLRGEAE